MDIFIFSFGNESRRRLDPAKAHRVRHSHDGDTNKPPRLQGETMESCGGNSDVDPTIRVRSRKPTHPHLGDCKHKSSAYKWTTAPPACVHALTVASRVSTDDRMLY